MMFRAVAAVIAGYLVMAIFVFATLSVAWMIVGSSVAFREGTTEVSATWLAINLPLSFAGALLGGWVAAVIARHPRNTPVRVLAALVLLLGLVTAVVQMGMDKPKLMKPISELSTLEAAKYAIQPVWYPFVIPLVGAAGVILGGKLYRHREPVTLPPADSDRLAA